MLSLDATQLGLVASPYKKVSWLFTVVDNSGTSPITYYWSTVTRNYGGPDSGHEYVFKVDPKTFNGVTLSRGKSELGIQAPNDLTFTIENSGNTLTASNFINSTVTLDLVISDGTDEATIATWKFNTSRCEPAYQTLKFTCEDFLQQYIEGDYPNTRLIKDISPSADIDKGDDLCVPVPIGECYIPLRTIYIEDDDDRYYLLGLASHAYTIIKSRSPRSWGFGKSEWENGDYTFTKSTKTIDLVDSVGTVDWRVFQAIICDSDGDGIPDANGVWQEGDYFLDMPTNFTRNDTVGLTSPENAIEFILEDLGISSDDLDTGVGSSFETSGSTYSGWGLTFNGAFYKKQASEKVIASLLNMCHSVLRVTDKIELHVLSKTSQKTITKADVKLNTFKFSLITKSQYDSGYIAWQKDDEAQDEYIKMLVPAKVSTDEIASEELEIPLVQDSQDVRRIGTLYYQRKFLKEANCSFSNKGGTLLALQPDDVVTINHADYGGNYDVLVDTMTIKKDLTIDFKFIKFSEDLDDWTDLTPELIPDPITLSAGWNSIGQRVFITQPYTPYNVGDIWTGGPTGDLKRCIVDRLVGAYQAADWELASEYTDGATWGDNITNQPDDALLLNELNCIGGYQEVSLPKEDGSLNRVDCYINNNSGTAYWFKIAEFELKGTRECGTWNGLLSFGRSNGRYDKQMRVKAGGRTDDPCTDFIGHYNYSGDDLTSNFRVCYDKPGGTYTRVTFYAYIDAWRCMLLDGAWSAHCDYAGSSSWIHTLQSQSDQVGTTTPADKTWLTATKNYTLGADPTADNTADDANNYTGASISVFFTVADVTNNNTANNTDYINGSVNQSGQGGVIINDDLRLYSGVDISFYSDAGVTNKGGIYGGSSGISIIGTSNVDIAGTVILHDHSRPSIGGITVGTSTYRFDNFYGEKLNISTGDVTMGATGSRFQIHIDADSVTDEGDGILRYDGWIT